MGLIKHFKNKKYLKNAKDTKGKIISENRALWEFRDHETIAKEKNDALKKKAIKLILKSTKPLNTLSKIKYKQALKENPTAVSFLKKIKVSESIGLAKILSPKTLSNLDHLLVGLHFRGIDIKSIIKREDIVRRILDESLQSNNYRAPLETIKHFDEIKKDIDLAIKNKTLITSAK